jgi:hypothetical protein
MGILDMAARRLIPTIVLLVSLFVSTILFRSLLYSAPGQSPISIPARATPIVLFIQTPTPLSFVATPLSRDKELVIWIYVACDQEGILFANPYCPKHQYHGAVR